MSKDDVLAAIAVSLDIVDVADLPTWFEDATPTVSLEDFFEGNNDWGSIGCNLGDDVGGPIAFYRVLRSLRDQSDVQDVRVAITELVDEDSWPFAEVVFIIASATRQVIAHALSSLQPDDLVAVDGEHMAKPVVGLPAVKPGYTLMRAWWD